MLLDKLHKKHLWLLAVLSGVLLSLAWPERGWPGLAFIALIPLFAVDYYVMKRSDDFSRGAMVLYSYVSFLVFNLLTTWWVINSTVVGAILAFVLNSLFMSLVYGLFFIVKRRLFTEKAGYFSLALFWVGYEYLHMHWSLSWSWLVFGNVFASKPQWVQWYEFTGVFGGSFWVIFSNALAFAILLELLEKHKNIRPLILHSTLWILLIAVPLVYSHNIYENWVEKAAKAEVVIVQPNVDPYNEQYDIPPEILISNFLHLADSLTGDSTALVVGPESALPRKMWENRLQRYPVIDSIRQFIAEHPSTSVLLGASTRFRAPEGAKPEVGARRFIDNPHAFYYAYNTALMFSSSMPVQIYHKSILVPGVEQMPFPKLMKPLEKLAINLGGTTGTLGISKTQNVFETPDGKIKVAPVICYESIYGGFVGNFVRNGANLIAIITNDGWWGNTPGYRQHFDYARLRAIEYRRDVVRSANTGKSAFFNQRGDAFQTTKYWKKDVIKRQVSLNDELTYYAQKGDYLAHTSLFIVSLLLLIFISMSLRKRTY